MFKFRLKFAIQKLLFLVSLSVFRIAFWGRKKQGTVIGNEEIASILYSLGQALPNSVTVNVANNPYYKFNYDYHIGKYAITRKLNVYITPLLLGYLAPQYKNFIYMSAPGFLCREVDGRAFEFKTLKKLGCNVICYFTGSDIRSFDLTLEFSKVHNMDVITSYQHISHKGIDLPANELVRKKAAEAADKYASAIFNPIVDQLTYIKRDCHPFLYFADKDQTHFFPEKFKEGTRKVIVHAPSSPIIKGTPIVRAAIKQLQEEGYDFEYIELIGVPNSVVLESLARAHIVLNEFYAFVPGVFGIETMMNNAVLLTSADRDIEPTLFDGANDAWVVTPYWRIYQNLKAQLESPMAELQQQADKGTDWVLKYCTYEYSADYINNVINELEADNHAESA